MKRYSLGLALLAFLGSVLPALAAVWIDENAAMSIVPPPNPLELCARQPGGVTVLSIQPLTPLTWDKEPRAFKVGVCNATGGPLPATGGLVAYLTLSGATAPTGQTYTLHGAVLPGYTEVVLDHWTPGLENHVTICVQKQTVWVEVKWSDNARDEWKRLDFEDGSTSWLLPVACGGDYS